jgi:hypothetical protein
MYGNKVIYGLQTPDMFVKFNKSHYIFYSVITVHLFTVTIYTHQLDATLFKKNCIVF